MKKQRNDDLYAETQVLDSAHAPRAAVASDADASELYDEYVRELGAEQKQRAPQKKQRPR